MHIPPYHKKPSWQRFFAGLFFGGIISYGVFIFMYGTMYEKLLAENYILSSQVRELEEQNDALLKDKKENDERSNMPITISSIDIAIEGGEQLRMDRLIEHQLEEMIKEEVANLIGQEVEIVSQSDQLLISTIENKGYKLDDFTYHFRVLKLTIATELKITVTPTGLN